MLLYIWLFIYRYPRDRLSFCQSAGHAITNTDKYIYIHTFFTLKPSSYLFRYEEYQGYFVSLSRSIHKNISDSQKHCQMLAGD